MYAIIMAGGQGTRLWPLSRRKSPKQLHSIMTKEAMIKDTYLRLLPVFDPDKIFVSTIPDFVTKIQKILPEIPKENYLVEPSLMGNAAACGLVSEMLYAKDPESIAFFIPSDAFIENEQEFSRVISFANKTIEKHPNKILTIGIKPRKPDVNYGYIKTGKLSSSGPAIQLESGARGSKIVYQSVDSRTPKGIPDLRGNDKSKQYNNLEAFAVECFVEKPDIKTAKNYVKSGNYFWNAGIFAWRTDHILELFKKNMPETFLHLENIRCGLGKKDFQSILVNEYAKVENTSIDFGIMEKTKDILVIPADFGWSDVGSWGSLLEVLAKVQKTDAVFKGHHVGVGDSDCLVLGGDKLIATIGLKNIVVIDTPDALLICDSRESHKVKEILDKLKEQGEQSYL